MRKEYVAHHAGKEILVVNSWTGGARLYIEGNLVDTDNSLFASPKMPMLRGAVQNADGSRSRVEVYGKSNLLSVQMKICVDGKRIEGMIFEKRGAERDPMRHDSAAVRLIGERMLHYLRSNPRSPQTIRCSPLTPEQRPEP